MSAHTPTPWLTGTVDDGRHEVWSEGCMHNDQGGSIIVYDTNELDAAHIVKCVNGWDDVVALRARLSELEAR